jgi:protein TonB
MRLLSKRMGIWSFALVVSLTAHVALFLVVSGASQDEALQEGGAESLMPIVAMPSGTLSQEAEDVVEESAEDEAVAEAEPVKVQDSNDIAENPETAVAPLPVQDTVTPAPVENSFDVAIAKPETSEIVETEVIPPAPVASPVKPEPKPVQKQPVKKKVERKQPQKTKSQSRQRQSASASQKASTQTASRQSQRAGNADLTNYKGKVARHLQRRKRYPSEARRARMEGTVTIRFTINAQGRVVASSITRSSGHHILDNEVLSMVQRANPFPRMPASSGQSSMTFTVPIRFRS